jgi:hypothetical protein
MNVGIPSQYFRAPSMKSFVASTFLDGIHVYGYVDPMLQPVCLYARLIQGYEPLGILGGSMLSFSLSFLTHFQTAILETLGTSDEDLAALLRLHAWMYKAKPSTLSSNGILPPQTRQAS